MCHRSGPDHRDVEQRPGRETVSGRGPQPSLGVGESSGAGGWSGIVLTSTDAGDRPGYIMILVPHCCHNAQYKC